MSEFGQIVRGSNLGEIIYNFTKREDVKNIVEIGTWFGLGSTKCIIDGIIDSISKKKFVSVELYSEMYDIAKQNLTEYLQYVDLMNGSIIDYEEIFWFDHETLNKNDEHYRLWYNKDLEKLKNSKNVLNDIPSEIDLLVLDGGAYSTYPEWNKLKDRTKIVIIDDINEFKSKKIVDEILQKNYISHNIVRNERNGYGIFEKFK
jgi:hypothetical protein